MYVTSFFMNALHFDAIRTNLSVERDSIVQSKRPEYTEGNADVLHNFKVVAAELGITPIQVWYVYFRKHVASISQFAAKPNLTLAEPISGRICDAMNYLELLAALVEDSK